MSNKGSNENIDPLSDPIVKDYLQLCMHIEPLMPIIAMQASMLSKATGKPIPDCMVNFTAQYVHKWRKKNPDADITMMLAFGTLQAIHGLHLFVAAKEEVQKEVPEAPTNPRFN